MDNFYKSKHYATFLGGRGWVRLNGSPLIKVYFAHPYSPWERGRNENTNGLLRRVLPKGTDLSIYTQEQLDAIAFHHNAKSRKCFQWKSPAEVFLPEGTFNVKDTPAKTWESLV